MNTILQCIVIVLLSSFFKCYVDSDKKLEFLYRRSECNSCKKKLYFYELIPFFSYIVLKGECRKCSSKIPFDVFLYELSSVVVAIVFFLVHDNLLFFRYIDFLIVTLLIYISIEDVKSYEINSRLLVILVILSIYLRFENLNDFFIFHYIGVVLIFHLVNYLLKSAIGYGDIKLFTVLSVNLTFNEGLYLFIFTFFYAGFVAIYLLVLKKVDKKSKLALAPYITLSYITILILREELIWL